MLKLSKIALAFILCFSVSAQIKRNNLLMPLNSAGSTCYDDLHFNWLAGSATTSGATSYSTGSVTPTANALVIVTVINTKASAPDTPTVSQNGHAYVQMDTVTFNTIASPVTRATTFRASQSSPGAGAVTADFGGATQTGCIIEVVEFWGADTSGSDGSGAVVQHVAWNRADSTTNPTLTITTPSSTNNAIFFAVADSVSSASDNTPPAGYTEIEELNYGTPAAGGAFYYQNWTPAQTTITSTATSRNWATTAIEIKPATISCGLILGDFFIDMNGQTSGNTLTTTIMQNGTRLGQVNTYVVSPATPTGLTVANTFSTRLNSVRVGPPSGTTYSTANASKCMNLDNTHSFTCGRWVIADQSGQNIRRKVSVCGFISIGATGDAGNELYDMVRIFTAINGDFAVFQLEAGTGSNYHVNIETNPGGATTHSSYFQVTKDTTYWFWFLYDLGTPSTSLFLYNSSGTLVNSITTSSVASQAGDYMGWVDFGNMELGASTGNTKFENIVVNTSGRFPQGP